MRHVLARHHHVGRQQTDRHSADHRPAGDQPTRNRREASLATIALVGGLIAFVCGLVHPTHFVAVCVGIVTVLFGLYSQLVSATTRERWINIIGIGAAFVGVGLGLSHGGFTI